MGLIDTGVAIGDLDATTKVTIKNGTFNQTQPGDDGNHTYESDTEVTEFVFAEYNNKVNK